MTYLALLAGVKGIIYYTYADSGFKVIEHPELWAAMQTLPPEIQALRPLLLDGQEAQIDTGRADVFAGAWTLGPRVVVCVVNTSDKEARPVSLPLPPAAKGAARPMFANRPASLTVQGGKLSGSVGPLEVQVYEFGGGDG
jgi:hypothetical protein